MNNQWIQVPQTTRELIKEINPEKANKRIKPKLNRSEANKKRKRQAEISATKESSQFEADLNLQAPRSSNNSAITVSDSTTSNISFSNPDATSTPIASKTQTDQWYEEQHEVIYSSPEYEPSPKRIRTTCSGQ